MTNYRHTLELETKNVLSVNKLILVDVNVLHHSFNLLILQTPGQEKKRVITHMKYYLYSQSFSIQHELHGQLQNIISASIYTLNMTNKFEFKSNSHTVLLDLNIKATFTNTGSEETGKYVGRKKNSEIQPMQHINLCGLQRLRARAPLSSTELTSNGCLLVIT